MNIFNAKKLSMILLIITLSFTLTACDMGDDNTGPTYFDLKIQVEGQGAVLDRHEEKILDEKDGVITKKAEAGSSVTLIADPAEDYIFDSWSGDVEESGTEANVYMDGDKEVKAVFREEKYSIEIIIEGEGEVKKQLISTQKSEKYPYDSKVELTVIPDEEWYFESWGGDLEGKEDKTTTIIMDSDKTVEVVFLEYAIQYGNLDVLHNFPTSIVDDFDSQAITGSELKVSDTGQDTDIEYKENQLIVRFSDGVTQNESEETLSELNYEIIDRNYVLNAYLAEVPESAKEGKMRAQNVAGIKYVELNHKLKKSYIKHPNDELFNLQWHYPQIRLPQTWAQTKGCDSVRIAVLDTGLDLNHPDIGDNVDEEYGYDFVNDEEDFSDDNGHGTHVAGTIGADTDNSKGVAGVMWEVDLLPIKVGDGDRLEIWDIVDGLQYASGILDSPSNPNPADVINMSFGGGENEYLTDAVEKVNEQTNAIMVGAAGNYYGASIIYPTALPEVIAVGAVDYNYPYAPQQADYSNEGLEMDVVAPGGDIESDSNNDGNLDGVWSTGFDDNWYLYEAMQGTSMSAPHVAGVIGLMLSKGISYHDVRNILHQTSIDLGSEGHNEKYGYGLINSYWAVNKATVMKVAVGKLEDDTIKIIDETSISSRGGEFKLDSIPEGYYRVFAWVDVRGNESIEPGDYFGISDVLEFEAGESYDLEGYIAEVKEEVGKVEAFRW